jgi:hypothetical protein
MAEAYPRTRLRCGNPAKHIELAQPSAHVFVLAYSARWNSARPQPGVSGSAPKENQQAPSFGWRRAAICETAVSLPLLGTLAASLWWFTQYGNPLFAEMLTRPI